MSIDLERHEHVLVVRLNRPEVANAMDPDAMAAIGSALLDAEHDDDVRVVVITGAGDRAFSAGMDLKAFAAGDLPEDGVGLDVLMRRVYPKPTIAAVNGAAVGGGFELMLGCDLVVAAEHARFGIAEVKRGLFAAGGGTALPTRVPMTVALELGLTGELIDAPRALALGLVNRVVPGAALMDEALALASRIAANGPLAVRVTKQLMYHSVAATDWDEIERAAVRVFESADAREGAVAFAEKRPPRWTGH